MNKKKKNLKLRYEILKVILSHFGVKYDENELYKSLKYNSTMNQKI